MKTLDVELLGQTRAAVLAALLLRPERALHVRELARLTGASPPGRACGSRARSMSLQNLQAIGRLIRFRIQPVSLG